MCSRSSNFYKEVLVMPSIFPPINFIPKSLTFRALCRIQENSEYMNLFSNYEYCCPKHVQKFKIFTYELQKDLRDVHLACSFRKYLFNMYYIQALDSKSLLSSEIIRNWWDSVYSHIWTMSFWPVGNIYTSENSD